MSWTIGSKYYDGINYGLFYSDHILEQVLHKIQAEAQRLKAKKILIGECGHASRVAKYFYPTYCGGKDALPVVSILEYTNKALKDGRIKLDPEGRHGPGDLPRSLQFRANGLDCESAAGSSEGVLRRLHGDGAQAAE